MDIENQKQEIQASTSTDKAVTASDNPQQQKIEPSTRRPYEATAADKQLLQEIKEEINKDKQDHPISKIQYVPAFLKGLDGDSKQYFKPRFISIGPVHAGNKKELEKADIKRRLAAKFIKNSGQIPEELLGVINTNIEELVNYFDDKVIKPYDNEGLARILFKDGCFVLQFIHSVARKSLLDIEINNGLAALIQRDLFLLENQIPFKVLNLLMNSMKKEEKEVKESIGIFIRMNLMEPADTSSSTGSTTFPINYWEKNEPVHLLDLLRTALLFDSDGSTNPKTKEHSSDGSTKPNTNQNSPMYECSFRNVQDLKGVGVTLKPSATLSLKDISFEARGLFTGHLKLPKLTVDESTRPKLLNLVAYEMCSGADCEVTSYLSFLDLLIDNEQDVKDLRSEKILRNCLSSDVEVAELFNKIGKDLVPNDAYLHVKKDIQKHCQNRWARWMAQICHDHFSSPWTMIALVAAVFALFLTAAGTWFTIYPRE